MSEHTAKIVWQRNGEDFLSGKYSRVHELRFDGGAVVPGSPSPSILPAPMSDSSAVDPEEAFVAAVSACHMLFFLSIAAKQRFVVDQYEDEAVGLLEKDDAGRMAITRIELRPEIVFSGDRKPSASEISSIHHIAHENCFIANSIKTDVAVRDN